MFSFTIDDLKYKGYRMNQWAEDDPRISGQPEHTLLDRAEAYEVLSFVDRYMESRNLEGLLIFNLIEAALQKYQPGYWSHAFWIAFLDEHLKLKIGS